MAVLLATVVKMVVLLVAPNIEVSVILTPTATYDIMSVVAVGTTHDGEAGRGAEKAHPSVASNLK